MLGSSELVYGYSLNRRVHISKHKTTEHLTPNKVHTSLTGAELMHDRSKFFSDYSTTENKLSKEVRREISLYENLSEESKFIGACRILQDLRQWEAGQLAKHEVVILSSKTPERKGILNQISYARKLISQNLNISIKTDQSAELWIISSAVLKRKAIIRKWNGEISEINY